MCPSVRSSALLPLALVMLAGPLAGCGQRQPPPVWEREDVQTLPMRPEWQRFVDDNYRGVVLAKLNSALSAPLDVAFVDKPQAVATKNKTRGTTELLAVGQVDVPTGTGVKYRRPYSIVWEQSGGGWAVADARVEPSDTPAPRPEEPAAPKPPTSRPATAPAEGTTAAAF